MTFMQKGTSGQAQNHTQQAKPLEKKTLPVQETKEQQCSSHLPESWKNRDVEVALSNLHLLSSFQFKNV